MFLVAQNEKEKEKVVIAKAALVPGKIYFAFGQTLQRVDWLRQVTQEGTMSP